MQPLFCPCCGFGFFFFSMTISDCFKLGDMSQGFIIVVYRELITGSDNVILFWKQKT